MNSKDFRNLQEAYLDIYQEIDESIVEEKKPLPVGKMRDKENRMREEPYTPGETRDSTLDHNRRLGNIEDVRRSVSTRGGKRAMMNPMPDVRRPKNRDEGIVEARVDAGKTDDQKIDARNRRRDGDEYVDSAKFSPLPGVRGDSESDSEIDHLSSRGKKKPVASSHTRQTKR